MPDLLTELQSALAAGLPLENINDATIGRWRSGVTPDWLYEDAIVGALMRLVWNRKWGFASVPDDDVVLITDGYFECSKIGTGPLPLLRAVRTAWEATK